MKGKELKKAPQTKIAKNPLFKTEKRGKLNQIISTVYALFPKINKATTIEIYKKMEML